MRLTEIGEAVKALSPELTATEPQVPWRQVARMRDHLAHRYFTSSLSVIQATVEDDLDPLEAAIQRMRLRV